MKKKDFVNLILLLLVIAWGVYRSQYRMRPFSETSFLMDTIVTIKLETADREGEKYLDEAFDLIANLEDRLSCYKEGSEIYNFNEGIISELPLDDDLKRIIDVSGEIYQESDSLYDISIGRISELWDFNSEHVPDDDSIATALNFVGFDKLKIENNVLQKPSGFKLNLGSLAKGYIIDQTVEMLQTKGIKTGYVNAGGDIRIWGQKKPLRIGIQHPREEESKVIATVLIDHNSIVTSGDYERYFFKDGVRYHHILNPQTGYPSRECISVTVIAPEALLADAYSTALFLMPVDQALRLVNEHENLEAAILTEKDGEIEMFESDGFADYKNKD